MKIVLPPFKEHHNIILPTLQVLHIQNKIHKISVYTSQDFEYTPKDFENAWQDFD